MLCLSVFSALVTIQLDQFLILLLHRVLVDTEACKDVS